MSEVERLSSIYPFDEDVLYQVAEIAEFQRARAYDDLQVPKPITVKVLNDKGYTADLEVLDINPDDSKSTLVYHLPMGNGLDDNMRMRVHTLTRALPTTRILATGNPSAPFSREGKLSWYEARKVWRGDLQATVAPLIGYMRRTGGFGNSNVTHVGYSYGAEKAAEAAYYTGLHFAGNVTHGIFMEPVSLVNRSLIRLGLDFGKTAKELDRYVKAADCKSYEEARARAEEEGHGLIGYGLALARLSNFAIAHAISTDLFESRVDEAMAENQGMRSTIIWGSESELSEPSILRDVELRLEDKYKNRVSAIEMQEQKHAMGDDLYLHCAMVLQALKSTKLFLV